MVWGGWVYIAISISCCFTLRLLLCEDVLKFADEIGLYGHLVWLNGSDTLIFRVGALRKVIHGEQCIGWAAIVRHFSNVEIDSRRLRVPSAPSVFALHSSTMTQRAAKIVVGFLVTCRGAWRR